LGELAEELLRDLLDHAAAELRELPDELDLGLDADLGAAVVAGRDVAGHGHARRARALRVLPLARHADAVVLLIHLRQLGPTLVARADRADLDAYAAEEGALVLRLDQLGTGQTLHDPVRVEQEAPHVLDGRIDTERILDPDGHGSPPRRRCGPRAAGRRAPRAGVAFACGVRAHYGFRTPGTSTLLMRSRTRPRRGDLDNRTGRLQHCVRRTAGADRPDRPLPHRATMTTKTSLHGGSNWRATAREIGIVVVGIPIAFALDSWWNRRTDARREAAHLLALHASSEERRAGM